MNHTKEPSEIDQIRIHMEMLFSDEMRAHAYADKEAHDLAFQVFRVLGGYREALDEIAKLTARISEQSATIERLREALGDVKKILAQFKCTNDEDSASLSYFNSHISEDWFYHVCFEVAEALAATAPERDWTEDFGHENGQYISICTKCGSEFIGHKRRVVCKACSATAPERKEEKDA